MHRNRTMAKSVATIAITTFKVRVTRSTARCCFLAAILFATGHFFRGILFRNIATRPRSTHWQYQQIQTKQPCVGCKFHIR